MSTITLEVPDEIAEKLREAARAAGLDRNAFVVALLRRAVALPAAGSVHPTLEPDPQLTEGLGSIDSARDLDPPVNPAFDQVRNRPRVPRQAPTE